MLPSQEDLALCSDDETSEDSASSGGLDSLSDATSLTSTSSTTTSSPFEKLPVTIDEDLISFGPVWVGDDLIAWN